MADRYFLKKIRLIWGSGLSKAEDLKLINERQAIFGLAMNGFVYQPYGYVPHFSWGNFRIFVNMGWDAEGILVSRPGSCVVQLDLGNERVASREFRNLVQALRYIRFISRYFASAAESSDIFLTVAG